ncbi:hypothetical protein Tco_1351468 [Tanacetum coccineum]
MMWLSQSDQDFLNTTASGNLLSKNTQEALTIIENKAKVRTCRKNLKFLVVVVAQLKIDAITALTKQVEALEYHIASMRETYDQNQEAPIQLMKNQMGQLEEAFQERPLDEELEPETITEVVEIASSKSTPLVPPPETPPLSAPKLKEDLKPNPHQPPIPCPSQLQEEKFHALENLTIRADHFVYRIDIVDSFCDKFPIENNSLSGNPIPSSNFVVESLSLFPIPYKDSNSLVEETDTILSHFDNSPPEYETFSFDIEEKSSSSTTTHSVYSLLDYEAFYFDDNHIEEKSSGSTTTHSDFSLLEYDSFIFDLSIDPLPPADRSDFCHEEFADELAHIISPPKYDYFYFDLETDPGEFTSVMEKNIFDISSTKDSTSIELNDFPLLLSDCDSSLSKEFSEIDLLVSFPSGNEDIIFDPGIFIIKGVQSERFHILPLDDFYSISFVSAPLFLTDPPEVETFLSFLSENEDNVFDPVIFFINGVFCFTRKSPHLLINNFMIDKYHIFREISVMTKSSVSFHPKDKEIRGESS